MMFRPDRRRQIDAVIDYFGESREARAPEPRPPLKAIGEYLAFTVRFDRASADGLDQILRQVLRRNAGLD
jgi:hypothetical protein